MNVVITPEAQVELDRIWNWNAEDRGVNHADAYLAFLISSIDGLSETYAKGKVVGTRPDLRYILMRRRTRGHGHVAVYTVEADIVTVIHIFHTAQDWQAKFSQEPEVE